MKLYNQLSKKVEDFRPGDPENVKIYTCGPTVYSYAHIGNFSSYIYWDLLVRTLALNGMTVNRVLNITDVGHLSSDADDGEDKLEKGAKREGKTVYEIADFYTAAFLDDYEKLKLKEPDQLARATHFIVQDMNLVDRLREKGYTYEIEDGVYFDTSKFSAYADFARLDLKNLREGARVAKNSQKKNPTDFAVWKFIKAGEDHAMRWDYLGRPGYPGWHLECATIVHTLLGGTIDIHTGGIDHIPVHHTNEIAEYEAAYGEKMSRFWLHSNHVTIENQKVSKSLGNTYTLKDLEEKGYAPLDFKLWTLQGHYQGTRNFNFEDLTAAKNRRLAWKNRIAETFQRDIKSTFDQSKFLELLSDNLASPEACAYIDATDLDYDDWDYVNRAFGIFGEDQIEEVVDLTAEEKGIIARREEARRKKDYETSDRLRAELEQNGITVKDTSFGPLWQYVV
ncbi:cysteine--tRNA ligase [Candidatus Saccharibacteria bacterium]|nr:cysteine--tRNA ligase [Candidatus Saccharibacteria bacterium]